MELFASWSAWAEKAGEFKRSQRKFSQSLEARAKELGIVKDNNLRRVEKEHVHIEGCTVERTVEKRGRGFKGIRWNETPAIATM